MNFLKKTTMESCHSDNDSCNGYNGYGAVILAAGYSSRMKAFKPLLDVGGVNALERLTSELRQAGVNRIIVVTGYCREKLQPVLEKLHVQEAFNKDYDRGMFSSIKTGLGRAAELWPEEKGFFLVPVDCPLISRRVIGALAGKAERSTDESTDEKGRFYVPVYEGKKGHPLLVPRKFTDEICEYQGPGGLKAVTDRHMEEMERVDVDEESCLLDMDTPEGYEEIKSFLAAGCRQADLSELASGRCFILMRHGQTRQHKEKMFIGRYDAPLSDEGRIRAGEAAFLIEDELKKLGVHPGFIYTSSLSRAVETAQILGDRINSRVYPLEELAEISLGPWDGKPVREIREKYPHEYELRGKDIFTFKMGNGSENFFDMQYRVIKRLKKILAEDDSRVIVIVAHSGVIRAIENNLKGFRVNNDWQPLAKGDFKKIIL